MKFVENNRNVKKETLKRLFFEKLKAPYAFKSEKAVGQVETDRFYI